MRERKGSCSGYKDQPALVVYGFMVLWFLVLMVLKLEIKLNPLQMKLPPIKDDPALGSTLGPLGTYLILLIILYY